MDQESALAGRKVRIGRFTPRDYDRVDSQSEKSMEYQQMFNHGCELRMLKSSSRVAYACKYASVVA